MIAGETLQESSEAATELADRFSAFALGCLGASSPSKAGSQLGIMGNVSEVELREVLCHLEALTKQRAAKQAGYPRGLESSTVCSADFNRALGEACGVDADHIHLLLPRDAAGKVDLLRIFRMGSENAKRPCQALEPDEAHCREYVDRASDLPASCADWHAACHLEDEPEEGCWSEDTCRINKLRAAVVHAGPNSGEVSADVLVALSRRCGSRRPALGKTALRALIELARASPVLSTTEPGVSKWVARAGEILTFCVAAVLVTKVMVRLCDEALEAILRRVLEDSSAPIAWQAMTSATRSQVEAGHPTAVVALLRAASLLPLGLRPLEETEITTTATAALLRDILKNRRFAVAFSEARALLRKLAAPEAPPPLGEALKRDAGNSSA